MHTWLARAHQEGQPLIDGESVTFLWQGKSGPALIGDFRDWEASPLDLQPLAPGLWSARLELPQDTYCEYAFLDPRTRERLPDPLNPRRVADGLGHFNHYFYMPAAAPTPLARRQAGVPAGTLTQHSLPLTWTGATKSRRVRLYCPPVEGRVPLLVVLDGNDYLDRGRLAVIVDNLIGAGRIRPIAMALVDHGRQARMVEYACSDTTIGMLLYRLLPLARGNLDLLEPEIHLGAYGVMGASMGGLMALYTGLRLPEIFGRVLSQSGAFWLGEGRVPIPEYPTATVELVHALPRRDLRIWMDVGRLESLLEANRRMHAALKRKRYRVTYREYGGGHNYTSWRNDLWRGLEDLFGQERAGRSSS